MKKHISLLLMLVTSLSFTGCYDLDRASMSELSSGTMWLNEDQCKQGVMGVYAFLYQEGVYGNLYQNEIASDVCSGHNGHINMVDGDFDPSDGITSERWSYTYNLIHSANTAIRGVDGADIDQDVKDEMLGELYFLRALNYFDLTKYYGGVPIYDESVNIESDYNNLTQGRSTLEEVYEFCLADLDKAIAFLPIEWPSSDYGRVCRSAAYALKGKIYLFAKDYANAITNFEEVCDAKYGHELYYDFVDLFEPFGGDASSEMIFAIQGICESTTSIGINTGNYAGNRAGYGSGQNNSLASTSYVDSFEWKDGRPFSWNDLIGEDFDNDIAVRRKVFCSWVDGSTFKTPYEDYTADMLPPYYDEMMMAYSPEHRDPRLAASVIAPYQLYEGWYSNADKNFYHIFGRTSETDYTQDHYTATSSSLQYGYMYHNSKYWDIYFCRKFIHRGDYNGLTVTRNILPTNYPVIRLADVYLMLAEAYNESGRQTDAVEYINKVRRRVEMAEINSGPDYLSATTRDEVFERIVHERAAELFLEGQREVDLRRWGLAEEYIANVQELSIFGEYCFTKYYDASKRGLWPIPQYDIDMNPNLEQNPGW